MLLTITILESLIGISPVYSQSSCYIGFNKSNYPDVVPAGQHFQVSTTVTVVCSGTTYQFNDVRVDLIDAHAQNQPAILSSNKYSYSPVGAQSVTPTIVNDAIAPSETGSWTLQINVYLIGRPSGTALATNQQQFNVQVVPYTPTTTTSRVTTTTMAATTTAATTSVVYTPMTLVVTSTGSSMVMQTPQAFSLNYGIWGLVLFGTGLVAAAVVAIMLYRQRSQPAAILEARTPTTMQSSDKLRKSEMFCKEYGATIPRDSKFCKECGIKLA